MMLKTSDGYPGKGWQKPSIISCFGAQFWTEVQAKTKEFLKTGEQIPVQYKQEIIGWVKNIECKEEIVLFFELDSTNMGKEFSFQFTKKQIGFSFETHGSHILRLHSLFLPNITGIKNIEEEEVT